VLSATLGPSLPAKPRVPTASRETLRLVSSVVPGGRRVPAHAQEPVAIVRRELDTLTLRAAKHPRFAGGRYRSRDQPPSLVTARCRMELQGDSRAMYRFLTTWTIDAPIERVWTELTTPEDWPRWWRGVLAADLIAPGDSTGLGERRRMTMRGALPYRLRFTVETVHLDRPSVIEVRADGELRGTGRWTLGSSAGGTVARYEWQVDATKPLMRLLGPVARPIFAWNHDVVMRRGLEGLRRRLRAVS